MNDRISKLLLVATVGLCLPAMQLTAQAESAPKPGMVELNFSENVDLKVLIDYVGKRTNTNFIYDQGVIQRKITINSPKAVPVSSLTTLLESVLRMHNLALVETEIPDTLRIEPTRSLTNVSLGPDATDARPTQAVTRVIELEYASANQIDSLIQPFLSATQASIAVIEESDLLIVTDYAKNMERVERLIESLDKPRRDVSIRLVPVKHTEATELVTQVSQLMTSRSRVADGPGAVSNLMVQADPRTNRLAVIGEVDEVADALKLIESLDVPLGLTTRVYGLTNVGPDRIDRLMGKLVDGPAARNYRSVIDRDSNSLIVTASPAIHEQIASLTATLDKPRLETQSPIRFYKLQNAKAADVLTTLQSIEGDTGLTDVSIDGVGAAPRSDEADYAKLSGPTEADVNRRSIAGNAVPPRTGLAVEDEELGLSRARLLADEGSNTIIVIARPAMHEIYDKLIKRLDVRRPQVLIEATVVALDTTDGFSLGVEILRSGDLNDKGRYLTFSNFGLSEDVDPSSPGLVLKPGIGFNGAVISANIADIVIQALESDSRAKVISKPSVLVNDNATGELISENEEPFSSVNASTTVSTTSFGGFASAGTSIRVTPQISEGDHLKLEYEIKLSSFAEASEDTDAAAAALPPARQTNSLISEATIPDGHTIVVGGLTRENMRESIDRLPVLGHIPGLEYLFSNRSTTERQTTLFVFIKAVILRDDKFEYLRFVSGQAMAEAEVAGEFPVSEPIAIP
jgi:general secretion pathway protein D